MKLSVMAPESKVYGGALTSFPSPLSSSPSDFEFTVCLSPSSKHLAEKLCPADELFYKGQLLPLQLSPRRSMVRTLLASSSTSSSSGATSTSRDSNGSSSSSTFSTDALLQVPDCDSSRPSSVTEEDACRRPYPYSAPKRRYLSSFTTRFSSVFLHRGSKKEPAIATNLSSSTATELNFQIPGTTKKPTNSSSSTKEKIKKYVKKVKPLYEKLSSFQHKQRQLSQQKSFFSFSIRREPEPSLGLMGSGISKRDEEHPRAAASRTEIFAHQHSFSWRKRCAASCPSSMRSSPSHSGLLSLSNAAPGGFPDADPHSTLNSASSMEELQSAIQSAIAHCKNTMMVASQRKGLSPVSSSKDDLYVS